MDPTAAPASPALPGFGDHAAALATRRALPPVSVYLRAVVALGLGSLRRGLPAVVFLYFYQLGMGLYLAFSTYGSPSLDMADREALIASSVMTVVALIPLLALVYTPFMALQDSILAGGRRSLLGSIRMVLERIVPFGTYVLLQCLLVLGPPTVLFVGAALVVHAIPQNPEELVRVVLVLALIPCILWILLLAVLTMFGIPALVLDSRGPTASLRLSLDLVSRHFGGLLGRLLVFNLLAVLLTMMASLPEAILGAVSTATGLDAPLFRIASVVWSSAVSALIFPFSVASLMVLYRAMVPGPTEAVVGTPAGPAAGSQPPAPVPGEPEPPASPFRFE